MALDYARSVPRAGVRASGAALAVLVASLVVLAAPTRAESTTDVGDWLPDEFDGELEASAIPDPIEPVNRGIFTGNRAVDRWVFDPVTRTYGRIVPGPIKGAVRNAFDNLNQPVVIANDILQLEPRRAASATARFLLNSTFGLAGIWDPAAEAGFRPHQADFGQTLGRYGVGPGIFLMLPLLGPSSTRDAFGTMVDLALRPDTWLLPIPPRLMLGGGWGISAREEHLEKLEALEQSSVDFYAAIRSAYWMSREAFVHERDAVPEAARLPAGTLEPFAGPRAAAAGR